MADEDDIWRIEELLWTGATDAFERRMADGCLMAFPGIGALAGEEIVESLKDVPRWQSVRMETRRCVETDGITVLSYIATGLRDGDPPYRALCTSTWRQTPQGWRLVQHQQSPPRTRSAE